MRFSIPALLILICFSLLSSACQPGSLPTPTLPAATLPASPTALPPTVTPSPPQPTLTATPSDPIYPYTIAGLRQRTYPAGVINVTTQLEGGADYTRYAFAYPSDGLTITGIIQVPANAGPGPFPVIVMNHGFQMRNEYLPGDGTGRVAEVLNRHGYLTIAPDYRSWGGSDRGYSMFYTGLVIDVIHLIKAIPSLPLVDPKRIGMWGHSMGGGVTIRVLAVDSSAIKAAVLYAPTSADEADLIKRWGLACTAPVDYKACYTADILPTELAPELLASYQKTVRDPQALRAFSPIYHLETLNSPVQIHIGAADGQSFSTTPPEWSQKLYDALRAAGKPAELFVYPDQGHSFAGEGRELFLQRILAFFDAHLKPAQP